MTNHNTVYRFVLVILYSALAATAFRPLAFQTPTPTSSRSDMIRLQAWSIPTPDIDMSQFSMKNSWYQECNPTARKTVYNDVFLDYGYESDDSDYLKLSRRPTSLPIAANQEEIDTSSNEPRKGPLRRAARWARKHLTRG